MSRTVSAEYPDIAWNITPTMSNGKLQFPAAEIYICNVTYKMPAAEFELKDGVVYLTPSGYVFIAEEEEERPSLENFPNMQNYWVCAVHIVDKKENILVLKAVQTK